MRNRFTGWRVLFSLGASVWSLQAGPWPEPYTRVYPLKESTGSVGDWLFHADYRLPGRAGGVPKPDLQALAPPEFAAGPVPVDFHGLKATQQMALTEPGRALPRNAFSVELWLNCHVSEEVGVVLSARDHPTLGGSGWALTFWNHGYSHRKMSFRVGTDASGSPAVLRHEDHTKDGFKEYWRHLVGVYDGQAIRFYVNAEPRGEAKLAGAVEYPRDAVVEAAGYFQHEPWMETGNLLRRVRLLDHALTVEQIRQRFQEYSDEVEQGVVFPGQLHFNAGPYLSGVQETTAGVIWETDRPAASSLRWGPSDRLEHEAQPSVVESDRGSLIRRAHLSGLQPDTTYFYEVSAQTDDGRRARSGLLSFKTAPAVPRPFRFVVLGDTETRPQINQQLGRLIWGERPSFIAQMGDLTDGGRRDHKFEWNLEYFQGLLPLASRIPVFPVPGNGEGDLYWFRRYHDLPGDEVPYTFRWCDAAFFMLDSVRADPEFKPGGRQYEWLDRELSRCEAPWKFVCLHYAPYTSDDDDYGDTWTGGSTLGDPTVRPILPLLERHRVDLVMFGHLHSYERMYPMKGGKLDAAGVHYLLCGGGGGNLEDFSPQPAFFTAKTYAGYHYCLVEVAGSQLTLRLHDLEGAVRDELVLRKRPE